MEETRELLAEMAGILEDLCRNQVRTLRKVADSKDLPASLREDLLERVRYMDLTHHKIRKFVEKVRSKEGAPPPG